MASRESSMNVNSGPAFPLPFSGSSSDGPPSMATDQHPFRAGAVDMLETGYPQSETSSRAIPPLPPPRPTPFPHSPRGVSGLRTLETGPPQLETSSGAIPPLLPPQLTPFPHSPPRGVSGPRLKLTMQNTSDDYPPSPEGDPPVQFPQPTLVDGGGKFKRTPPFNRDPSRVDAHRNTTNYHYRFDTMPSARSDSDPPHNQSGDVTGGAHADVWPIYNKISKEHDDKMLTKWNSDLDVLLVFVSVAFAHNR